MKLKSFREKAGITQSELAKMIGVSAAYVCMCESGQRRTPTYWFDLFKRDDLPSLIQELRLQDEEQRKAQRQFGTSLVHGLRR